MRRINFEYVDVFGVPQGTKTICIGSTSSTSYEII